MRRFLLAAAALALGLAPAAEAAIGTPVSVGNGTQASLTTSLTFTTANDVPAGDLIVLDLALSASSASISVSDGGLNTYTQASTNCTFNTSSHLYVFYAANAVHVPAGTTITITWTGNLRAGAAGLAASGLATSSPLDVQATCQSGTSTTGVAISPAVTTGVMAQNNELVVGGIGIAGGSSGYSPGSPFAAITNSTTSTTPSAFIDYHITSTGTSAGDSYAPSWTTARPYGAGVWTFKSVSSGVCVPTLSTLGVSSC